MKRLYTTMLISLFLTAAAGLIALAEDYYEPSTEAKLQYNQGIDYNKKGQYDLAMSSFRQAIDIDPNYIDAYYNLGSILEFLGQDEAALSVFKQVIVRNPNDYESVYKAANLSAKLGRADKAKSYLALIPPESSVYSQAKRLASSLNTDMQTIKVQNEQIASAGEPKITQTNDIYNDIISPTGITTDEFGNLYVACYSGNTIYKITPDGKKIVYVKDVKINGPIGMVRDSSGNIYIANYNANNVIKITPAGGISAVIQNIPKPYGLHLNGNLLFVSLQGSNSVMRYKL